MDYGVNAKGRKIYKGSRGGMYVMQAGRKVYKVSSSRKASPVRYVKNLGVNSQGRKIYQGARGGYYVMQGKRKVYDVKLAHSPDRSKSPVRSKSKLVKRYPKPWAKLSWHWLANGLRRSKSIKQTN